MSCSISGTTITLTRGDSFCAKIDIFDENGNVYTPVEGDRIRFAMKKYYDDAEPALVKDVSITTLLLELTPEDTRALGFGKYAYDLELTAADGRVDTFIANAAFILSEEVF